MSTLFGAVAQGIVGVGALLLGIAAWIYWSVVTPPTVAAVFHISMFFGCVACYAIIATALGYRATERVEEKVENVDIVQHADEVEHADEVKREG